MTTTYGLESDSVAVTISFSLQSNTVSPNMIESINNTLQASVTAILPTGINLTEESLTTLAFQPNCKFIHAGLQYFKCALVCLQLVVHVI